MTGTDIVLSRPTIKTAAHITNITDQYNFLKLFGMLGLFIPVFTCPAQNWKLSSQVLKSCKAPHKLNC